MPEQELVLQMQLVELAGMVLQVGQALQGLVLVHLHQGVVELLLVLQMAQALFEVQQASVPKLVQLEQVVLAGLAGLASVQRAEP